MGTANHNPSAELLAKLAQPSASYKNSARLAVAGLLAFVLLYFALAGWFLLTAYRLVFQADPDGRNVGWGYLIAACALFFAFVMLKGIFAVRNANVDGLVELKREEQPRLFEFLNELADAAGAPRPHKVFLSERVNAAVFYDLSLFNLIVPSKKNLEIGLALVNVLNRGELRAVLAHEFGHFAQRSMAVGRWVYVAQQITGDLVSRRDKIDGFLNGLARIDLRVRAGVMVLQLIVWSIRSLVESAFRVVVIMQRALSREMEMQADLVAVSLTGSDALIHALHRLQSADDAWDRAAQFAFSEKAAGRPPRDVFALQSLVLQRMADILDDASYGQVPSLPQENPSEHRVFKAELAQPPRMWQTHPLNHEREANAKRIYVQAEIDPASAWSLFDQPLKLREDMTRHLLTGEEHEPAPLEDSLHKLGKVFRREHYKQRYCGVYFGRALARHVDKVEQLREPSRSAPLEVLARMYPESLKELVQRRRALEGEAGQLQALIAGVMTARDGVVRLRGEEYTLPQLPAALEKVKAELEEVHAQLHAHDLQCRSWHRSAAAQMGGGWAEYLDGLLALIHYAEHSEADLLDLQGLMRNTIAVATATGKSTDSQVADVVIDANYVHALMEKIYKDSPTLVIDAKLKKRLGVDQGWVFMLGEFGLPLCSRETVNEWLGAVDSWVQHYANSLSALRSAALEQLLITEALIAKHARMRKPVQPAPEPSRAPSSYALLPPGGERQRRTKLSWWARFQRADGWLPGFARLAAAGGIVAVVLGVGSVSSKATLIVYNGLAHQLDITIDGERLRIAPLDHHQQDVVSQRSLHIETRTMEGELVEAFDSDALDTGANGVYNVAAAAPLVEWTNTYGSAQAVPERRLNAPRWLQSHADVLFAKPPESISTKSGGGTRTVLEGLAKYSPSQQLSILEQDKERDRLITLHARWDDTMQEHTDDWLMLAVRNGHADILAERLKRTPEDVNLLRAEQEAQPDRTPAFCAKYDAMSASKPESADLKYIALRCQKDSIAADQQMLAAHKRWPYNPWLAYSAAYIYMQGLNPQQAIQELKVVRVQLPPLAPAASLELARLHRLAADGENVIRLANKSPELERLLMYERGEGKPDAPERAYAKLQAGELAQALASSMGNDWQQAQVLRLAAASDGASADMVKRALALPPEQGMDGATVPLSIALALKHGADPKPYMEISAKAYDRYHAPMMAFLSALKRGQDPLASETILLGRVPMEVRAYAYGAGMVLLGPKTPPAWRQFNRRLLFASERPFFR
ncbi:M48 family metalloprotease [Duganella sp. FT135W]|uniref:M48 family metalloprotease n=1 Tax=Duganella flavida TaxID=2692175 RepID=A0A6L8K4H1_9BURK|nr:M48 family metalloprotease [Duganella flavida]